jgi:hypothetical protein
VNPLGAEPAARKARDGSHPDRGSNEMKRFLALSVLIAGSGLALWQPVPAYGQVVIVTHRRHHRRHHRHPVVVVETNR